MPRSGGVSRRIAVKTIGVAACGLATGAKAQAYHPQNQLKLTKAAARYQDHPNGYELCGGCPYFAFPGSCVLVEGQISPQGWCPMFTTFSPLDRGAHR
jgi:hypothetical protein